MTVRDQPVYPIEEIQRRWHGGSGWEAAGRARCSTRSSTRSPTATRRSPKRSRTGCERLEDELLRSGARTERVLLDIYEMKKELARFRRAVVPMRDILSPIMRGDVSLLPAHDLPYFRDVYDHVARAIDQLDDARDLVNNARDTHIAMAINRQNDVSRQLTIVATVFLPLTFITGFFGQNFGWLVNHITGTRSFLEFGIGSEIVAFAALLGYFRYKRWF